MGYPGDRCTVLADSALNSGLATIEGRPSTALGDQLGDQGRPARLVARAQPGAVVAVEILAEWDQVSPVGVRLEQWDIAQHRASAVGIEEEDPHQPPGDVIG